MADAMHSMQVHHGKGIGAFAVGTLAGAAASGALGVYYGWQYGKWHAKWMPVFFAAGGKMLALATWILSKGKMHVLPVAFNDIGQAGVNALALHGGVVAGLKLAGKHLDVVPGDAALAPGGVRVAGALPPADPGRGLENLSVEELANLR